MAVATAADLAAQVRHLVDSGEARARRQRAGLTLQDAAWQCGGVDPSAVMHWERGTRAPRGRNLHAYASFLNMLAGREAAP